MFAVSNLRHYVVALCVVALAASVSPGAAQTVPTKLINPDRIQKELSRSGAVRVIVYTTSEDELRDLNKRVASRNERATALSVIRNRVDPVVKEFYPAGKTARGGDIKTFGLLPAFSSEVSSTELKRLQTDPRIHKIQIDELKTINLNSSVPLMGIPSGSIASADAEPTGVGRVIAVIDTGVQANHPFIGSSRVVAEACFLTTAKCPNGSSRQIGAGASKPASGQSHGTHVAGIALGHYATGSTVYRGVASKANLVMVNVFGSQSGAYTSDIILALEFIDSLKTTGSGSYSTPLTNIDAVNMSLGGDLFAANCDGDPEKPVIDSLRSHGVVTVIAAGNDGSTTKMSSPGCISSAVSVAATSKTTKAIASYSNLSGVTTLFAPGGESGNCITSSLPGSKYGTMCGTSMATPHVAGAVALLRQAKPGATVDELIAAMTYNMDMVSDTRGGQYSKPFLNVQTALSNLPNMKFNSLTINLSGVGGGAVMTSPGVMTCQQTGVCAASLVVGSTVNLTALPDVKSKLGAWDIPGLAGTPCTSTLSCSFVVPDGSPISGLVRFDSALVDINEAVDTTLPFSGTSTWFGVVNPEKSLDGEAARSAAILDNQSSFLETSVTGPGNLSFNWSVSSESNYDFLRFYVDGVIQSGSISGNVPFAQKAYSIPCGTHTIRWSYEKDGSISIGDDAGYLDQVGFTSTGSCPATQSLSVTLSNASWGSVTSTPSGILCGGAYSSCSSSFTTNSVVVLRATAVNKRRFTGWSGACTGSSRTCSVSMATAKSVTANFK